MSKMRRRIAEAGWERAKEGVRRFVPARAQESLNLWGTDLFLQYLARLSDFWR